MTRFLPSLATVATLLLSPAGVLAVDAKAILDKLRFPSDSEQKVRAGEFVETSLETSSERDLNVGIAFLVKTPPDQLARKLRDEMLLSRVDPAERAYGKLAGDGATEQLADLKLTPAQVKAYASAKPGDDLNLSSAEIAALNAVGGDAAALQAKVRELLLVRYRAYRAKGLAGIAPYARKGSETDPAGDIVSDNRVAREAQILPAAFCTLLESYPKGVSADLVDYFYWSQFEAHGADTIALVHVLQGTFEETMVTVQRQYYVSTGYNIEQAITGLLPDDGGTLVIYTNHTSTDQVAGFGGSAKRGIGRKLMASQLRKLFDKARAAAVH